MKRATLYLATALAAASCGGGGTDKEHSSGGSSWTLLVYMTADNDLEPFALQDLNEMMRVGSAQNFNLVVQVDRSEGHAEDAVGGLANFTSTKRVIVRNGSLEEIADLGELNMADPATLTDFVTWGMRTYPADRTGLVFWDHGGGWTGFGVDEASGNTLLKLPDIEKGIADARASSGTKPFAFIGFDACLMATWEVSKTLVPHAEYLLASEETEPGHGWDWTSFQSLASNPSTDVPTVARAVIDGFRAQAVTEKTVDTVTLSLIDLYRLDAIEKALTELTTAFGMGSAPLATAFARGEEKALRFGDAPEPERSTHMVDLSHFVTQSSEAEGGAPFKAAQQKLKDAISNAVLAHTEGSARNTATGMSIYFPPRKIYYAAGYDNITAAAPWKKLLDAYFASAGGGITVPKFTDANKVGTFGFNANNDLVLSGTLATGSAEVIARSALLYGVVEGPRYLVLGQAPANVTATNVDGTWDVTILTLSQGTNTAFAYTETTKVDATRIALNLLFTYRKRPGAPPQDCVRQMVFSADNAGNVTLTSDTYYVEVGDTVGELSPEQDSTLMPLIKTFDPDTGVESVIEGGATAFTTTAVTGGGFEFKLGLEYKRLASGTHVFAALAIENAQGEGDAVANAGLLP